MAVQVKRVISIILKSQTYFGQFQVCVWLVSCLAIVIGTEILYSLDDNLKCDNHYNNPQKLNIVCPENQKAQQRLFTRFYAGGFFAIWMIYTTCMVPKLWVFSKNRRSTSLCSPIYLAYFLQVLAKLVFHVLMLFMFFFYVYHRFPLRLNCVLEKQSGLPLNVTATVNCTEKYRLEKSAMQTAVLLTVAVLTLFALIESVYIFRLIRWKSRTIFTERTQQPEFPHNGSGCWCLCAMPSDRHFVLFQLNILTESDLQCQLQQYFDYIKRFSLNNTKNIPNALFEDMNEEASKLDDMFIKPEFQEYKRCILNNRKISENACTQQKEETSAESVHILITGDAGVGKTTLARKVVRNWAKGSSSLPFALVLLLDYDALCVSTPFISLQELIRLQFPTELPTGLLVFLRHNPQKIMVAVDNVHNRTHHDCEEASFGNTFEDVMPIWALYNKLVSGKLLLGATILTLSRMTENSFNSVPLDSRTEILGFSPQAIKDFIRRYFAKESLDKDDLDMLVESLPDDTLSLCSVPLNCFYVCSYLKWVHDTYNLSFLEAHAELPETITQLYVKVVQMIVKMRRAGSLSTDSPHVPSAAGSFPDTACHKEPTWTDTTLARSYEGSSSATTEKQASPPSITEHSCDPLSSIHDGVSSLAKKAIDEEKTTFGGSELRALFSEDVIFTYFRPSSAYKGNVEDQYTFRCCYLQEFLAAYFLVSKQSVQQFERFVAQVKDDASCRLDLVLQFACGLLSFPSLILREKSNEMLKFVEEMGLAPPSCNRKQKDLKLLMIRCVAESRSSKLPRQVASQMIPTIEFPSSGAGVSECSALASVLGHAPFGSIRCLDLSYNKIGVIGMRQITQRLLVPGKGPTQELKVQENSLDDYGLEELAAAIKIKECRLRSLNVAGNCISSDGVSTLAEALSTNTCLEELDLSNNGICNQGVAQLSTVLGKEDCKIARVNLGRNNIGDEGVGSLASVQQRSVDLSWNNIGYEGVKSLVSIFPTLRHLEELDLSGNDVKGAGLEALLHCLLDPSCKIKTLELNYCQLKDEGVAHCVKVLTHSQNLVSTLGVAGNSITDDGSTMLANALCSPKCKLASLNLSSNTIGDEGVQNLSLSLSNPNCNLQELDLSLNKVQSKGCGCLAAALRKRNCLQALDLRGNQVGDNGAAQLLSALRIHNCKLQKLVLDSNDISDQGISGLPHAFRSPHCRLGQLNLGRNSFSPNNLTETLSEALRSPFCHLEQLDLKDCDLTREMKTLERKQSVRFT